MNIKICILFLLLHTISFANEIFSPLLESYVSPHLFKKMCQDIKPESMTQNELLSLVVKKRNEREYRCFFSKSVERRKVCNYNLYVTFFSLVENSNENVRTESFCKNILFNESSIMLKNDGLCVVKFNEIPYLFYVRGYDLLVKRIPYDIKWSIKR